MSAVQHELYRTAKGVPRQDFWEYEDYPDTGGRNYYDDEKLYRLHRYAEEHKRLPIREDQYYYESQRNYRVPRGYRVPEDSYDSYRRPIDKDYVDKRSYDRYYDTWDSIGRYPTKYRDDGGRYIDWRTPRDRLGDDQASYPFFNKKPR